MHAQLATTGFEGTPQFAAPEQLRGEPLDVRADIYAVGATLYYLLTGQPPFDARDLRELVERVNTEPPKSPRVLRPRDPVRTGGGRPAVSGQVARAASGVVPPNSPSCFDRFQRIGESPASRRLRVLASVVDIIIVTLPFSIFGCGDR